MRDRRNGNQTVTENEAPTNPAPAEAKAETESTQAKRPARPPIDVGEVLVTESTRDLSTIGSRPSRITSDPVYLAVQNAEFGKAVDLHVLPSKVDAVHKRLRTASDAKHLKVGMTIVPGTPVSTQDPEKVVVTFVKREERATRTKKDVTAAEGTKAAE